MKQLAQINQTQIKTTYRLSRNRRTNGCSPANCRTSIF